MPDFDQIGRALAGFGAGVQGRGTQFLQGLEQREQRQQQQQKQLSDQRRQAMLQDNQIVLDNLLKSRPGAAIDVLSDRIGLLDQLGADSSDTRGLLQLINDGKIEDAIQESTVLNDAAVIRGLIEPLPSPDKPKQQIVDGQLVTIGPEGATATGIEGLEQGTSTAKTVQSSDILPDGTIVKVFKSGLTEVSDPQGAVITGQRRADKIREAREFGAEVQGKRSRERTLGSEIAKTSIEVGGAAFKKLPVIRGNIANLDKVISAIDKGAKSGAVERFLPSVRAASVELDNLRNQLGLDVIGDVTFGALSKGELDLALDTALPTGLDETELKAWAENKRSAQTNVLKELRKTAKFFSLGGTITEYLTLQDKISAQGGDAGSAQTITSQAEFDALPSGAVFIEDGQEFRKP